MMRPSALIFSLMFLLVERGLTADRKGRSTANDPRILYTEPDEIISLMESRFKNYSTYTASFKEWTPQALRSGTIKFKKPHSLLVAYLSKEGETDMQIYSSAEKLYVYIKFLNIVVEQDILIDGRLEKETKEADFRLLVNLKRLIETYHFDFLESKVPVPVLKQAAANRFKVRVKETIKGYHFLLTPKDKTQGFNHMELWLSPSGYVLRCKSRTVENRVVDYLFFNIETDKVIPDSEFAFDIPATAEVLRNTIMELEEEEVNN